MAASRRTAAHRVRQALNECQEILWYQITRWTSRGRRPADHAHTWRALADDTDAVIHTLSRLRDYARDQQHRLQALNGDRTP